MCVSAAVIMRPHCTLTVMWVHNQLSPAEIELFPCRPPRGVYQTKNCLGSLAEGSTLKSPTSLHCCLPPFSLPLLPPFALLQCRLLSPQSNARMTRVDLVLYGNESMGTELAGMVSPRLPFHRPIPCFLSLPLHNSQLSQFFLMQFHMHGMVS